MGYSVEIAKGKRVDWLYPSGFKDPDEDINKTVRCAEEGPVLRLENWGTDTEYVAGPGWAYTVRAVRRPFGFGLTTFNLAGEGQQDATVVSCNPEPALGQPVPLLPAFVKPLPSPIALLDDMPMLKSLTRRPESLWAEGEVEYLGAKFSASVYFHENGVAKELTLKAHPQDKAAVDALRTDVLNATMQAGVPIGTLLVRESMGKESMVYTSKSVVNRGVLPRVWILSASTQSHTSPSPYNVVVTVSRN